MGNYFKENRTIKKILLIILMIFFIIIVSFLISTLIVRLVTRSDSEINILQEQEDYSNEEDNLSSDSQIEENEEVELKKLTGVIIGLDKSKALTDVIMVVQFDPKNNSFKFISIPRDMYINFYDTKYSRIRERNGVNIRYCKLTEVYQNNEDKNKSVKIIEEIAEKIVGIPIDYYVKVDLDGFRAIVDLLEGIEVDIPHNMNYDDWSQDLHIHLEKGIQTLDGEKAEQLVRNRNGYVDGDLGRIRMQQKVLKALGERILEINNPLDAYELIKEGYKYVETDFSLFDGMEYIKYLLGLDINTVFQDENMMTIPTYGEKIDGLWFQMQDKDKTRELLNELFRED